MSGFGEKLRREREMRGVSIEEISESTKIGSRSLRALEEDDFEKLPGGIFNKGFVRAYAKFLGLNEDQTVADFDAAWKEYRAAKGQVDDLQLPIVEEEEEPPKSGFAVILAIAILLVAVLLAGGYVVKQRRTRAIVVNPPQPEPTAQSVPPPATSESGSPSPSTEAQTPSATSVGTTQPAQSETPKHSPESISSSSSTTPATPEKSQAASAASTQSQTAAPIRLDVFAREDSWLSVLADGKNLGQGVLTAQKSRTIRAQKEVKLKLGNVGGVEVSFNGKPVNIDGEPKQVKELTFTPEGLRQ